MARMASWSPGDVPALGAALDRLLGDLDLRRRLGEGGRAMMRREFSIDGMVEGNLGVYQELLGEPA